MPTPIDFEQLWAMQPTAFQALIAAAQMPFPAFSVVLPDDDAPLYELNNGVAVIRVEGVISRDGGFWGVGASLNDIQAALDQALADSQVKSVLFSINSPGGQVTGVKELADSIFAAKRVKSCAAFADGLCCSSAYWIAASTGSIYAGPSATVGSIGVILRHMDKSELNKQWGLNFTYIAAGSYKAVGNPDAPLSERDLGVMQDRVNAIYEMFSGDVAQHMGLALDNRAAWADGRDFLASEAERLGLLTAIVPNRAFAIQRLIKETTMDKAELSAKHPELLAAIQQEATEAARKQLESEMAGKTESAAANLTGLIEAVCGKETADKIVTLAATGLTSAQLLAVKDALGATASDANIGKEEAKDDVKKAEILAALKDATPQAVPGSLGGGDETLAAIKRMGAI
ncbi:MAG: S49 family peptidase [Desulfovibrio sp.]|nr:S49 family peptidase [Desulfovibrio sp.]